MAVRVHNFAGIEWYDHEKDQLNKKIEWCFKHKVGPGKLPQDPEIPKKINSLLGIVSPHAGYSCSGPHASHGYLEISQHKNIHSVVVLGTNHTGMGSPTSLFPKGEWQTPLGSIEIDDELHDQFSQGIKDSKNDIGFAIELFSELILSFTKSNTVIIDPISNFGSIGYAAGNLDITRKFVGFKFNENIKIKFFKEFDLKNITFFTSTLANNIDRLSKENSYVLMSELIFSSLESEERNFSFQKFAKEVSNSIELLLEHNFIVNYVIIGIQNTKHSCNYNYNTKKILDLINSFDFNLKSELIWKIYDEDFFNIKSILLSKITNKSNIERLLNDKRILIFKRD